jgi:hypothetical protein
MRLFQLINNQLTKHDLIMNKENLKIICKFETFSQLYRKYFKINYAKNRHHFNRKEENSF